LPDAESEPRPPGDHGIAPLGRRERIVRYLHEHPEYDEPQTNGELTFFMAQQASTGKLVVTARFNASPEMLIERDALEEPVGAEQ
jgi:hypothetical protein